MNGGGASLLGLLGRGVLSAAAFAGANALVLARTTAATRRLWVLEILRALRHFGLRSLPVVLAVGVLSGALVVVQTSLYVERFGARLQIGWAAGYAVLWEFGPLLLGLTLAAQVGARNAAELASLKLGGQLEGLRGISLDPFALLVGPRVVAIVASMMLLTPVVLATAFLSEAVAARLALGLPLRTFVESAAMALGWSDILGGLTKAFANAWAIALLSSVAGLQAEGGARAVGRAASRSMVHSCVALFALDFLLTALLSRVLG